MSEGDHLGLRLRQDDDQRQRRRRHRTRNRIALALALVVVAAIAAGIVVGGRGLLHRLDSHVPDYTGTGHGKVTVQVKPGDSLAAVGQTLLSAGVVKSVEAFTGAARDDPAATRLQPGYYRLRSHMSGSAALHLLLSPSSRISEAVTVPEGSTVAQVVQSYDSKTPLRAKDLDAALNSPSAIGLPSYAKGKAEGFLFPATYQVDPSVDAKAAMAAMVKQFDSHAQQLGLDSGARSLHLTPYDIVKVASILEKEAGVDADFPKVARVIYNRLARGMRLQLDSTLNYVLAQRKAHLSNTDVENPSPYNTYTHSGLPPTPIDNPGATALRAALHPASGDWLYFVTIDKAGHSAFTDNYAEFLRLKEEARAHGVIK